MGVMSSLTVFVSLALSAGAIAQAATFNDTDVLNFALNLEVRLDAQSVPSTSLQCAGVVANAPGLVSLYAPVSIVLSRLIQVLFCDVLQCLEAEFYSW